MKIKAAVARAQHAPLSLEALDLEEPRKEAVFIVFYAFVKEMPLSKGSGE
jgi:Zn-dependent alcohol dehydrogenase